MYAAIMSLMCLLQRCVRKLFVHGTPFPSARTQPRCTVRHCRPHYGPRHWLICHGWLPVCHLTAHVHVQVPVLPACPPGSCWCFRAAATAVVAPGVCLVVNPIACRLCSRQPLVLVVPCTIGLLCQLLVFVGERLPTLLVSAHIGKWLSLQ